MENLETVRLVALNVGDWKPFECHLQNMISTSVLS